MMMMNDEEDNDCNDYHNAVVDGDSSDDDDDDIDDDIDDDDEEEDYDEVMASTMLGTTIQMDGSDGQNDETGRHDDGACGDCPDLDGSGDEFHNDGDG